MGFGHVASLLSALFCFATLAMEPPKSGVVIAPVLPRATVCAQKIASFGAEQGLSEFLNRFPVIRVGVTNAPNFGHQISSLTVANRVAQLGFEGRLEIVYETYTEPKLAVLVPGFDPSKSLQIVDGRTYISRLFFDKHRDAFAQIELALIGAEDQRFQGAIRLPDRPSKPSQFKAQMLVCLQPANWIEGDQAISLANGYTESIEDLSGLPHVAATSTVDTPAVLKPALAVNAEIAPFYNAKKDRVATLVHYLEALTTLPKFFSEQLSGPVVVPVLSEFSRGNTGHLISELLDNPHTRDRVLVVAQGEHFRSEPGKVTVVIAAELSPEQVYTVLRQSTLPPAVSGKFSTNQLFEMGLPYMEIHFDDALKMLKLAEPDRSLLQSTQGDFSEPLPRTNQVRSRGVEHIRQFVLLSRLEQGQSLRDTFAGTRAPDLSHDKTTQALLRAKALFETLRP